MHTRRRRVPALLVACGLGLALVGVLTRTAGQTVPLAFLLVLVGAAAALRTTHARQRPVRPTPPGLSPGVRAVPLIPTQRTVRTRLLPPPPDGFTSPDVPRAPAPTVRRNPPRPPRPAAGRPAAGRPRHCVLPRGEVPHQRRAPGAS